jgi:hypothetical protein
MFGQNFISIMPDVNGYFANVLCDIRVFCVRQGLPGNLTPRAKREGIAKSLACCANRRTYSLQVIKSLSVQDASYAVDGLRYVAGHRQICSAFKTSRPAITFDQRKTFGFLRSASVPVGNADEETDRRYTEAVVRG